MLGIYNILLLGYGLITLPYWVIRILLTPKYRKNFKQRFGSYPPELIQSLHNKKPVWLHAVSVGETLTAITLVKAFKKQYPDIPILISNVTVTGNQIAHQNEKLFAGIIYFPLDFSWIVRKTLSLFQPRLILIMETEIWPNFLNTARKQNIPVVLLNGRISDRSVKRYLLVKPFITRVLSLIKLFLMQSKEDASRIARMGAPAQNILTTGNIKFDIQAPYLSEVELTQWKKEFGLTGTEIPVWLAGSTHPSEEEIILQVFSELREIYPNLHLILVPRHPERAEEIVKLITASSYQYIRRTDMKKNPERYSGKLTDIYLIDTVGELMKLYLLADIAFVGGSFATTGGHNVLEPAVCEKPILFGPNMSNFRDSAKLMVTSGGGIQVNTPEDLTQELKRLLQDSGLRLKMGKAGAKAVFENSGTTAKTIAAIKPYLN